MRAAGTIIFALLNIVVVLACSHLAGVRVDIVAQHMRI
jgi:hypothetical protein